MNIVIYARFSCHSQNEQSIEGQLKTCYEFAERNSYKIVGEYIDRATTGTSDSRPEFQRMVADSAKRQFQGVLVYQLDRFARNRYDSATYKAKLKKNGVKVLSARENISDDASGILIEGVLESMAEYYSVELGQKIRRGMEINAEKCLFTGSGVSLGYDIDENKRYIINEEEAAVVQKIYDMYIGGMTMAEIIRHLNEKQIKTSHGKPFNKNSLRTILKNRRYLGIYIYKDTEVPGGIPRIIEDDIFYQVQDLMVKNKKAPARSKAVEDFYLLTTKIYCGYCMSPITGVSGTSHTGRFYQYYKCASVNNKCKCEKKNIRKAQIEDRVIEATVEMLTPDYIDKIAHAIEKQCEKERNTDELKRIEKLIRENDKATANLINALEQGKAADVISAQIEKRQQEKANLETQFAKERIQAPLLKYEQIKFFFERFINGDINVHNYRQSIVDTFISRIELYNDGMEIIYNAHDGYVNIPLGEPQGSPKGRLVDSKRIELSTSALRTRRSCKVVRKWQI